MEISSPLRDKYHALFGHALALLKRVICENSLTPRLLEDLTHSQKLHVVVGRPYLLLQHDKAKLVGSYSQASGFCKMPSLTPSSASQASFTALPSAGSLLGGT